MLKICLIHNIRIGYPKRSGSNILSTFLCSIMLPFVQYLLFEQLSNHRIGLEVLGIPSQQPMLKLFIIILYFWNIVFFSFANLLTSMSLLSSPISAPSLTRETKSASFLADNSSTCAYNSFKQVNKVGGKTGCLNGITSGDFP